MGKTTTSFYSLHSRDAHPVDEDYEIGSGWRFINFASKDGIGGVGALLSPDASRRLVAATGTHRHSTFES